MDRLAADATPLDQPVVLEQVITPVFGDACVYHLVLGPDAVCVRPGPAPAPTVTLRQSMATAWAVFRGDLAADEAFIRGDITLTGDATALLTHRAAIADFGERFAPLADVTQPPAGLED